MTRQNPGSAPTHLDKPCRRHHRDRGQSSQLDVYGVLAVGIIAAIIARFKPLGMSRTLFATALAQALVAVIALIAGLGSPASPQLVILILNGFFVALFVGSALLFRMAAREHPTSGVEPAG